VIAPVLKYPGAKWRIADWIIGHMPPHEVYVEPFFGSGAVFFKKPPSRLETINDINGHVVNLFRVVRERPVELARAVEMTPWSREEYEASYERPEDLDPIESARRFLVRTWQGHGSAADQYRNGWRVVRDPIAGPRRLPQKQWANLPERILAATERLREAQIERRPALDVIRAFASLSTLVYADPPYVLDAVNPARKGRRIYDHQMTDDEHEELLAVLLEHPGPVLLSGYDSPLYRRLEEQAGWARVDTRARAEKGSKREEILWLNPAAAAAQQGRLC
jgi:DNA adenine methylase